MPKGYAEPPWTERERTTLACEQGLYVMGCLYNENIPEHSYRAYCIVDRAKTALNGLH